MNERELESDAEPRFNGHGGAGTRGTAPRGGPASDREAQGQREHSVSMLAKRVDEYLEKARNERRYDRLVIVAPPKFLGTLRKELGKEVAKLVTEEVPKDLSWLNARQIEQHLSKGNGREP
jgi:protein required for attachment to host cells